LINPQHCPAEENLAGIDQNPRSKLNCRNFSRNITKLSRKTFQMQKNGLRPPSIVKTGNQIDLKKLNLKIPSASNTAACFPNSHLVIIAQDMFF